MKDIEKLTKENQQLQLAVHELSILNDIATSISSTQPVEKIIDNIILKCIRHLKVEEGSISLLDRDLEKTQFHTMIRKQDLTRERVPIKLDNQITGWMVIHQKPLLSNDIKSDDRFTLPETGFLAFKSILSVPLMIKGKFIGYLAVYNKKGGEDFLDVDRRLLTIIASQSAQIIENARLYEEEQAYLGMKEEMRMATEIQRKLLPDYTPQFDAYQLAAINRPAKEVGGDYYDFIELNNNHLGFCIADITGKGMPAALLMANLQASLRSQTMVQLDTNRCVKNINRLLFHSTEPTKFATLFYGVLDPLSHTITYCNAGHDQPIHLKNGSEKTYLEATGMLLGVLEETPYESSQISIEVGDMLVLYSDGITEAMNSEQEQFGLARLTDILETEHTQAADTLQKTILSHLQQHSNGYPQSDDITLMIIKRVK